jgi:Rab GDP dissociation inhibitor
VLGLLEGRTDFGTDDIRDIYRRAAREELVVEGLREGQSLVAEE